MLEHRYQLCGAPISGGMSTVAKYHDNHLDRLVAYKRIDSDSNKNRLHDEIQALSKLRSNHVVQIYDVVIENNSLTGFIEEYVDGPDLEEYIQETQLSAPHLLRLCWQISSGIRDIHSAGIIHRDIKPNNIKVDREGIVKIFDFGLSKDFTEEASTIGFKGTLVYCAPEQHGQGKIILTEAIDSYSFAALVAFLCGCDIYHYFESNGGLSKIFNTQKLLGAPETIYLLERCLNTRPEERPAMNVLASHFSRILLQNKHRALLTYKKHNETSSFVIDSQSPSTTLSLADVGSIKINYDGFSFRIKEISGEVKVNNTEMTIECVLPTSCVISLGDSTRHYTMRAHITFDSSRPEVIL